MHHVLTVGQACVTRLRASGGRNVPAGMFVLQVYAGEVRETEEHASHERVSRGMCLPRPYTSLKRKARAFVRGGGLQVGHAVRSSLISVRVKENAGPAESWKLRSRCSGRANERAEAQSSSQLT